MANELLQAFLDEHVAEDGKCSCGWKVADYDLDRSMDRPMSPTEAWSHHVRRASYDYFDRHGKQYVETVGPDGEAIAFILERSTLLHNYQGWMLDYERRQREQYGYQYDGYEPPSKDPDDCGVHLSCEEAECRDPYCSGGHFSIRLSIPTEVCAGCEQPFAQEDERVGVMMQIPAGQPIKDGTALATMATYHPTCQPSDGELREHADDLWSSPQYEETEDDGPKQAMACLSCGLAGETPEEHFPQEPGLWDRPCPKCGEMQVWVTEATNGR